MKEEMSASQKSIQQQSPGIKEVGDALVSFDREVGRVEHGEENRKHLMALLGTITNPEYLRLTYATLATSPHLKCKALAVALNPSLGKQCADDIMEKVRTHLQTAHIVHNAQEASTLLYYAQAWYEASGTLTAELDLEIRQGLDITAWVHKEWNPRK